MPKSKHRKKKKQSYSSKPQSDLTEFTGFMGWMQNNQKWFYLGGILFLVLSLGASIIFSLIPEPQSRNQQQDSIEKTIDEKDESITKSNVTSEADKTKTITRRYNTEPKMIIDINQKYQATIETVKGSISIELFATEAPGYVNNFVFLAKNNFYDGLTFHRVLKGFVVQGGDPSGTGSGGPGYKLTKEINDLKLTAGTIAMAQSGEEVSGSQFFIALSDVNYLKQQGFTPFGIVTDGFDVLKLIRLRDPSQVSSNAPAERIIRITITEE